MKEVLGCLGSGVEETDYLLCDGDIDILPKLYKQDEVRFEYNQGNQSWSRVSCTVFGAIGMVSDLKNYEFPLEEIREVDEGSYDYDCPYKRIRGQGRYTKRAVDYVQDYRNKYHSDLGKILYYRINKFSEMIETALDYLYTLEGNLCPTTAYNNDFKSDGMLDGKNFGTNTNGHAVDIIKKNGQRSVKDSYKGRKTLDGKKDCNIYGLRNELKDITNFGSRFYIYTNVDNLEEIKKLNEIKTKLLQGIPLNSELRHLTNSQKYKKTLNNTNNDFRERLEYINNRLKELS